MWVCHNVLIHNMFMIKYNDLVILLKCMLVVMLLGEHGGLQVMILKLWFSVPWVPWGLGDGQPIIDG